MVCSGCRASSWCYGIELQHLCRFGRASTAQFVPKRSANHLAIAALVERKEATMTQNSPENSQKGAGVGQTVSSAGQAARGTPGTGENICPQCQGKGRVDGAACPNCGGTATLVEVIGG